MKFIDLCAGIGGFSLGLEWAGMTCVAQVEIDEFCKKILTKHWPHVPKWGDVKALDPGELPAAELICGGYPCQPFSIAGQRRGADDDRHLWPFIRAIVKHVKPAWCLFENVAGHISLGLDSVLSDLEALGYSTGPVVVPACAVNAPHWRDRVWIIANLPSTGNQVYELQNKQQGPQSKRQRQAHLRTNPDAIHKVDTNSYSNGCQTENIATVPNQARHPGQFFHEDELWRRIEPCLPRGVHGIPNNAHRIAALGNAVVPQVVCEIGKAILKAHMEEI
jgi:DNA (cytosine-5)-methyltransferase 1